MRAPDPRSLIAAACVLASAGVVASIVANPAAQRKYWLDKGN